MIKLASEKNNYHALGVMSGTSVDGLDLALVRFDKIDEAWEFNLIEAATLPYDENWQSALKSAIDWDMAAIMELDVQYAHYLATQIASFLEGKVPVDFIASHGHTVLHQPERGITLQIGDGDHISADLGIPVVSDFRSLDVSLGGQGAPLVPVGDRDLFSAYDYCLNLGGIANISFNNNGKRQAFDICPINMALDPLAQALGQPYDEGGKLAQAGNIDSHLLESLNNIPYCHQPFPKSLGLEDYQRDWLPVISQAECSTTDKLSTVTEHVALQTAQYIHDATAETQLLVTGGGAFNDYFIARLKAHTPAEVVIPDASVIHFKEAIVFAYLGLLRVLDKPNCLASVTGASHDNSGGKLSGF